MGKLQILYNLSNSTLIAFTVFSLLWTSCSQLAYVDCLKDSQFIYLAWGILSIVLHFISQRPFSADYSLEVGHCFFCSWCSIFQTSVILFLDRVAHSRLMFVLAYSFDDWTSIAVGFTLLDRWGRDKIASFLIVKSTSMSCHFCDSKLRSFGSGLISIKNY